MVRAIIDDFGGSAFQWTRTTEERNKLWQARHDMYWAGLQIRPGAKGITTDVCVPISRLAECVGAAQEKAASLGLISTIVGHVGDGNFHALLLIDMDIAEECSRADDFVGWLNHLAMSMDGTCTGEHGVGQGKRPYLKAELGETTRYMAASKVALDPDNIMNPGKILID